MKKYSELLGTRDSLPQVQQSFMVNSHNVSVSQPSHRYILSSQSALPQSLTDHHYINNDILLLRMKQSYEHSEITQPSTISRDQHTSEIKQEPRESEARQVYYQQHSTAEVQRLSRLLNQQQQHILDSQKQMFQELIRNQRQSCCNHRYPSGPPRNSKSGDHKTYRSMTQHNSEKKAREAKFIIRNEVDYLSKASQSSSMKTMPQTKPTSAVPQNIPSSAAFPVYYSQNSPLPSHSPQTKQQYILRIRKIQNISTGSTSASVGYHMTIKDHNEQRTQVAQNHISGRLIQECIWDYTSAMLESPVDNQVLLIFKIYDHNSSTLGWTLIQLFNSSSLLNQGHFKLPIYKPPCNDPPDVAALRECRLVPDGLTLFISINADLSHETSTVPLFVLPRIHRKTHAQSRKVSMAKQMPLSNITQGLMVTVQGLINHLGTQSWQLKLGITDDNRLIKDDHNLPAKRTSFVFQVYPKVIPNTPLRDQQQVESLDPDEYAHTSGIVYAPFMAPFYLDMLNTPRPIYLVIHLYLQAKAHAWAMLDLTHPHQVGRVFLPLYLPPIVKPPLETDSLRSTGMLLDLTMGPVTYDRDSIPEAYRLIDQQNQSTHRNRQDQIDRATQEQAMSQKHFIKNEERQFQKRLFEKGMGVDIYIDAARFLPDYTTVTKVEVAVYSRQKEKLSAGESRVAVLGSNHLCPRFDMKVTLRLPHLDPTLTMVVTLLTIDSSDHQVKVLGYSALNLFLDRSSLQQPTSFGKDYILQMGCYQLDIFCEPIPAYQTHLDILSFQGLDKLPCASLLVRIQNASNTIQDAPLYSTGRYNNEAMTMRHSEMELFELRAQRPSKPVLFWVQHYASKIGIAPHLLQEQSLAQEQNLKIVQEQVDLTLRHQQQDVELCDLKYFNSYDQSLGIRVSVDGLLDQHFPYRKNKRLQLPVCLVSVFPGPFYSEGDLSSVLLVSNFNWNSPLTCPTFNQYYQTIRPTLDTKSFLVLDIRIVNFTNKIMDLQLEPYGFSILPLFLAPKPNINSGHYQLPVYQGAVRPELLQQYYEKLIKQPEEQNSHFQECGLVKDCSLFIRVLDFQRDGHLSKQFDLGNLDTSYLAPQENSIPVDHQTKKRSVLYKLFIATRAKAMASKVRKAQQDHHQLGTTKRGHKEQMEFLYKMISAKDKKENQLLLGMCPMVHRAQEFNQELTQAIQERLSGQA